MKERMNESCMDLFYLFKVAVDEIEVKKHGIDRKKILSQSVIHKECVESFFLVTF